MNTMRRQRYVYTLPPHDEEPLAQEWDEFGGLQTQFAFQDPLWTPVLSPEPEPIIPYYLYHYPMLPVPSDTYQSVTSLYSSSFINPYESVTYFSEGLPDNQQVVISPPISDSGYGDGLIPEVFASDPLTTEATQSLPEDFPTSFPIVTSYGSVAILLRHLIRVDISPDKSIYVSNLPAESIASANGYGDKSCVIHPNGRVFHDGGEIHMSTLNRKAKISRRGVVFTSSDHCLSYLVDASGTKTTAEKFRSLSQDFSQQVFFGEAVLLDSVEHCYKMVDESLHKTYRNGDEVWIVGGFRIKQDQWGDVKVSRNYGKRIVKASPTNGHVSIKTDSVEISVSRYPHNYFSVRRGNQLVTASLKGFSVQNGTQKAGFNGSGRLVLK